MRIDFECSGGFANLNLKYHADTDKLPQELAQELLSLVENASIFDLQHNEVVPRLGGPPDVFFYRLLLQDGSRKISMSFNDVTAPATLQPLLALLRKLALNRVF